MDLIQNLNGDLFLDYLIWSHVSLICFDDS